MDFKWNACSTAVSTVTTRQERPARLKGHLTHLLPAQREIKFAVSRPRFLFTARQHTRNDLFIRHGAMINYECFAIIWKGARGPGGRGYFPPPIGDFDQSPIVPRYRRLSFSKLKCSVALSNANRIVFIGLGKLGNHPPCLPRHSVRVLLLLRPGETRETVL